jgi:hypothetical protein
MYHELSMENRLREFGYGGRKRSQVLKGQQPLSSNDANTIIDINLGVNVLGVC